MRFDMTITADTPEELSESLLAIVAHLPARVWDAKEATGFSITVSPTQSAYGLNQGAMVDACLPGSPIPAPPPHSVIPDPSASPAPAKKPAAAGPKVNSKKGAPAAAAPAPASALAAQDPLAVPPEPEAEVEAPDDDRSPFDDDEPAAQTPAAVPAKDPKEAKAEALEILRSCFGLEKGADAVKRVQKEFGGVKFADVPDSRGVELLDRAVALKAQLTAASA